MWWCPMHKFLCGLLLFLCGCGYEPLYAPQASSTGTSGTSVQQQFSSIYVMPLAERTGQLLRNDLLDRGFTNNETASMALTINNLLAAEVDLGLASDNTATRRQLTLQGRMILTKNGVTIADRDIVTRTTYNVLVSQYGTIVSRDSAIRQAVEDFARQVETHAALLLRQAAP